MNTITTSERPIMSDYMAQQMDSQIEGAQHTYEAMRDRIEALEAALAFYADPTRYHGPNQSLDSPDAWSERVGLTAYRLDVTRDHGAIARNALKGQP